MSITLKNYSTELPKALMTLAGKNKVRECDETTKGQYVAYVDEGKDSYDVALSILPGKELTASSCDCKNGNDLCRHKVALLMHIADNKKTKTTVKPSKKKSPAETLLDEADAAEVKEWVRTLIEKNKDLKLAFIQAFSSGQQQYTPEDVTKIMTDAVKAVGVRKNVDTTQLKRLVELWASGLEAAVQYYLSNVADAASFKVFHTIIDTCFTFHLKSNTTSNKILKYIEGMLGRAGVTIHELGNEEAWYKAVAFFTDHIPDGMNKVRMHYLLHVEQVLATANNEKRRRTISTIVKQLENSFTDSIFNGGQYVKAVFRIVSAYDLFPTYHAIFSPLRNENEFNRELIEALIAHGYYDLAKQYCDQQIKSNYKEEYNITYWELLREIYKAKGDEETLVEVMKRLIPYTFHFDDHLFILAHIDPRQRDWWRSNVQTMARNSSSYNKNAREFYFKLLDDGQKYQKMIELIDTYSTYSMILPYFEKMMVADKKQTLEALLTKGEKDWHMPGDTNEEESTSIDALYNILEQYHAPDHLRRVVTEIERGKYYYRANRFLQYIKQRLALR